MLKRIWSYFRKYKILIVIAVISSLIVAASQGATAYAIKPTLDGIFIDKNKDMLLIMPVIVVMLFATRGVFVFLQMFLMRYSGQKAIESVRNDLYSKIITLPLRFFGQNSTGVLMSRITNDVNLMQSSIPAMVNVMRDSITLVGLVFVVLYQDLYLALFSFIVFPFIGVLIVNIGKKMKRYSRKGQEKMGILSSVIQESFSGVRVVKAFATEGSEVNKFKKENANFVRYTIKRLTISSLSSPLMELIGAIGIAIIVYFGGLKVINGATTPGTFFSFMAAVIMMYEPFKKINKDNYTIQAALAAAERVFEVMSLQNDILDHDGHIDCNARGETINFEDVYFRYENNEKYILKEINLEIKAGAIVAVVGPSGAGKSTWVNLIARFYEVTKGAIKIDGVNIRDFKIYSLRRNIGFVAQEPFLFNDTVRNNISYGFKTVDDEQVIRSAKAAYAHDFIMQLPDKYDTVIGERGVRLSGGQKQRLTIARALIKDPPILILDEATSSLDTESEKIVQKALDNLMIGRTSFVIAHRLSTIIDADMIVVLNEGKIDATGRHNQLLKESEVYSNLYKLQFKNNVSV